MRTSNSSPANSVLENFGKPYTSHHRKKLSEKLTVNPLIYFPLLFALQKLCMFIRSWCPDRTLHQARKYIADTMGERYAEGVILNLEATWEESNPQVPLICFLSMGSDPTGAIENLAKRKGIGMFENQLAPCISFWLHWSDPVLQVVYVLPYLRYTILETQNSNSGGVHQFSSFWATTSKCGTDPTTFTHPTLNNAYLKETRTQWCLNLDLKTKGRQQ